MAREQPQEHQQLIVRMPAELHAAIRDQADADDMTMAQLVRRALREYLERARVPQVA